MFGGVLGAVSRTFQDETGDIAFRGRPRQNAGFRIGRKVFNGWFVLLYMGFIAKPKKRLSSNRGKIGSQARTPVPPVREASSYARN